MARLLSIGELQRAKTIGTWANESGNGLVVIDGKLHITGSAFGKPNGFTGYMDGGDILTLETSLKF